MHELAHYHQGSKKTVTLTAAKRDLAAEISRSTFSVPFTITVDVSTNKLVKTEFVSYQKGKQGRMFTESCGFSATALYTCLNLLFNA